MQIVEKPWGTEEILECTLDYMVKKITMNRSQRCSLQFHNQKVETVYVINGPLYLTVDGKDYILNSGDSFTIWPRQQHRMQAGVAWSAIYIECSTPYKEDVVRVEDDYGRK